MRKQRLRAVTELVQGQKANEQQSEAWILGCGLCRQLQILTAWAGAVWRQKTVPWSLGLSAVPPEPGNSEGAEIQCLMWQLAWE